MEAGAPVSTDVDVSLLIGDYEAKRLLGGRQLPHAPLYSVLGDASLLDRFLSRYLGTAGWQSLGTLAH